MSLKQNSEKEILQQQLHIAERQLELIKTVTDELVTELDLNKLLDSIAIKAREVISAETLTIPVIHSTKEKYTYQAAAGKNAADILNVTFPISTGMCGWVLSNQKPLIFAKDLTWSMNEKLIWEEGMESSLLVPLMARGEIVGGLSGLGKQGGGTFTQQDFDLLQIFANQVSVAIDNARIFEELSEEKERSETTLNSIGDAVITTDTSGRVERVNPVASQLLGVSDKLLRGKPLVDVFKIHNSKTGEKIQDPVARVISSGEIVGLGKHTVLVSADGREYQIADSAAPIRNDHNELIGVILVFHDVTEEYKLNAELLDSERKHRQLVENLSDEFFMFTLNKDREFSYISPSVFNCLGFKESEFIEKCRDKIIDNEAKENLKNNLHKVFNGIQPQACEIDMFNSINEICNIRITHTPVFNSKGSVVAVEGLAQNITNQKVLEESLRHSQKMEAVGHLSGGIAHDFNNQLGVVLGYLEMLKDEVSEDPRVNSWIKSATKGAQRCAELTKGLLDFSRKKDFNKKTLNLNESLLGMQSILQSSITPSIELKFVFCHDVWDVMADDGELQDSVLNLIINARDAMTDGGVLEVKTENIILERAQPYHVNNLAAGKYVKLSVNDSGSGMSEDVLEHIFEPFFTTKMVGKGTGLGMAMLFGFVERVKGAINIESELGKGSCVEIYFPKSVQKNKSSDISDNKVVLSGGNESILLVEDEVDLCELAEIYLTSFGYKVYVAENSDKALDLLKDEDIKNIDLLFSDVVMPGRIDGFMLAEKVKKIYPEIKVLMATGYASHKNIENTSFELKKNILFKPYTRKDLAIRIRAVLDH
ncbi:MAG: hypothetical protein DIZ80_11985 [endosymbiont of Galathealinum brachiosum]|uniref:histidine kinase n=1 Tax=endosymbiont of Galathealinum brachiosum TaxID=2200906 RepID=A0A370DFP6_9GAMM|nr:MAG: hypothetical protein DIZ80_11985 [endosymbiont of Galathealinum brachiosum]